MLVIADQLSWLRFRSNRTATNDFPARFDSIDAARVLPFMHHLVTKIIVSPGAREL
jgi:hypothetical protein